VFLSCLVCASRLDYVVHRVIESSTAPMLLPFSLNKPSPADTTTATNTESALLERVRIPRRVMCLLTVAGMVGLAVLGTAVPASASPAEFTVDYVTYTVDSVDLTTVAATAYDEAGGPDLVIPNTVDSGTTYTVTSIGSGAFADNLLTSVTSIGDHAFCGNNLLESVTFAGSAPTLGTTVALGPPTVTVFYYAKYADGVVGTGGFTAPTWYGYTTSTLVTALTVSLDLGLSVGDTVAGAPVDIAAEGLLVGSAFSVVVRSTPITIASGFASNTGTISGVIGPMPSGLSAGPHTVTFTGTDVDGNAVSRVAYLTVSDTGTVTYLSYTAAEGSAAESTLAETGFDAVPLGLPRCCCLQRVLL
jgi:hypothetical protein